MRVVLCVGHGIVDIDALMVEQLSIGHHRGILEVLTEATSHQVHMDPGDVFRCEDRHVEILGVAFGYFNQLLLLLQHSLSLFSDASFYPVVLK